MCTTKTLKESPTRTGKKFRVLDDGTDFSGLEVLTKSQATHINSATYSNPDGTVIAATLFQPGHAVLIHKDKNRVELVKDGLSRPHGFYPFGRREKRYVITSPTTGVIDILGEDYAPTHAIKAVIKTGSDDRTWLQNTFPVTENLLALIDHYNFHIVFFDIETRQKAVIKTHEQWKIFQILVDKQHERSTDRVSLPMFPQL